MHRFLDSGYKTAIRKNEPIMACGLTFYPIKMERFDEWLMCKPVLLLRMATLPAVYAVMPFLSAVYAMDYDALMGGKEPRGLMSALMYCLCLALDIPTDACLIKAIVDTDKPRELKGLRITALDVTTTISVQDFREIRQLIAEQNGETLPDEAENPELLAAQQEIAAANAVKLDPSTDDLISAVALHSGVRDAEIYDWTIREFQQRLKLIDRGLRFTVNAIAEGYGASWKKGNPCPSWIYARAEDESCGFRLESDMLQDFGKALSIK